MVIYIQVLTALILGIVLVYITVPATVRLSKAKNLFDVPNERKVNKTVVPNLGGVAIFIGISISALLSIHGMTFSDLRYILVAMIIMFFVGLKDDILLITAKKKFLAQVACAVILVSLGDIRFSTLHGILGIYQVGYVSSFLLSILTIVAIINSINLIDGIDGLAAGLGILISGVFGSFFLQLGQYEYAILAFSITGSLLPFFLFNVFGKKNKIFMGDTGSLILGVLFAVFTIQFNEAATPAMGQVYHYAPVLSLAIISVPLLDMIRVFFIRVCSKKSPFTADMNHIHHKLLRLGYSHLKATLIIVSANAILIGFVFLFRKTDQHILLFSLIAMDILLAILPNYLKAKQRG